MIQGTDDLEEVLGERLQKLPSPMERQETQPGSSRGGQAPMVIPDELPEERSKVGNLPASADFGQPCHLSVHLELFQLQPARVAWSDSAG